MDSEGAGSREVRLSPGKQACHFLLLLVILHCSCWIPHLLRWEALAVSAPPPPPLPPACPPLHKPFPPGSSNQLALHCQSNFGKEIMFIGLEKKRERERRGKPGDREGRGSVGLGHIGNHFSQATPKLIWMEVPEKGQMGVEDLSDRMTRTNVVNALIDGLLLFCDYESSRNYSHQVTCDSGPPELELWAIFVHLYRAQRKLYIPFGIRQCFALTVLTLHPLHHSNSWKLAEIS